MIDANDPRLTAYVLGELDDAERAEIERELEQSDQLRDEVEAIRQSTALLGKTLQAEPCPALTDEQRAAAQDVPIAAAVSVADRSRKSWPRPLAALTTLAAAAAIIYFLAIPAARHVSPAKSVASHEDAAEPPSSSGGAALADFDALSGALPVERLNNREMTPEPRHEIRELNEASGEELGEGRGMGMTPAGPSVSIGLDADGTPTADSDFGFSQDSFGRDPPAAGGFGGGGLGGGVAASPEGLAFESSTPEMEAGGEVGDGLSQPLHGDLRGGRGLPADTSDLAVDSAGKVVVGGDPEPRADFLKALQEMPEADSPITAPASPTEPNSRDETSIDRRRAVAEENRAAAKEAARIGGTGIDESKREQVKKTWRRANATPNASRLVIGDHDELLLEGMQVNVLVDGFRARVLLDLYYFNNRDRQLEGNFKLRLPNEASLYYFAFGQSAFEYRPQVDRLAAKGFLNGELVRASSLSPQGILAARDGSWNNVKEARIVPREKAAHAYSETVRRRIDPALVEWSGAGMFNARVFPLLPNKLHRIVVGYDVNVQQVGDDLVYQFDLPDDVAQCMVDLNISALPGTSAEVQPATRPFTSSGRAYYHLDEVHDQPVTVRLKEAGSTLLTGADAQTGEFFATRITPVLPAGEMDQGAEQAVFLLDTSLSSRPDKFNIWLDLMEATLEKNHDSMKQFAVLFFNIESHWWKEGFADNTPENVDALLTYCHSLSLEGATDLRQALLEANAPAWAAKDEGESAATDLFLLSDGAVTWGEMNVHRLSAALAGSGSALFAYQTGMTGTATGVLEHLTRDSGGAVFSVVNEEEVAAAATAHRSRPWKLLDVTVPGGSDLLVAGRPQHIYAGQPLLVVGRGEPDAEVMLHLRRGDEEKHLAVPIERVVESELAPRLYGQVAVGQLEELGSSLEDVSVAYARHFRVTGQTCSLLMLDREADYQRFNIKPEDDAFVVRSTPSAELITKKLDELAEQLGDAKAAVVAWLGKLESTPGFQFKVPTALRLVIKRLPREAFEVDVPKLVCKSRERGGTPKELVRQLDSGKLEYLAVATQARERFDRLGAADGLKTLSNLIEQNPGDPVLTRDVAFSAIEWGLGGQAFPLLKRVASMRPYEPQSYEAMAQCLSEIGNADLAMIYYEVALNARWHERYKDIRQIAGVEYLRLLRRIDRGELSSHAPQYARARLDSLVQETPIDEADLVVTMMWNTDRTDVDLHVIEPTGEECFYDHPQTRIGGRITRDVTEGLGPEMYTLVKAKPGKYQILANYFGSDRNRTQVRTKVYITIYEDFGGKREHVTKKTITLSNQKEKRKLATVTIP